MSGIAALPASVNEGAGMGDGRHLFVTLVLAVAMAFSAGALDKVCRRSSNRPPEERRRYRQPRQPAGSARRPASERTAGHEQVASLADRGRGVTVYPPDAVRDSMRAALGNRQRSEIFDTPPPLKPDIATTATS
jgi:hypothetical protein